MTKKSHQEWTTADIRLLRDMRREGYTTEQMAAQMGGRHTEHACRTKVYRLKLPQPAVSRAKMSARLSAEMRDPYRKGKMARSRGEACVSPYGHGQDKWQWLAGWHDADMEAGVSYIDKLKENQA